jgi:hypothetical protein
MKKIKEVIYSGLAMGGILLDKFTPSRILLFLILISLYLFNTFLAKIITAEMAVLYFALLFLCRYIFLFGSFVKNGIGDYLKKRFGETEGFEVYQIITAIMFFQSGMGFGVMINKTEWEWFSYLNIYADIFFIIGGVIVAIGFLVNLWCTLIVGVGVYYYQDLFLGRPVGEFSVQGPYKIFSNPMYGIGQAGGYGTALMYGSLAGVVAILMNQVMMFTFYFLIEKPHIQRVFGVKKDVSPVGTA